MNKYRKTLFAERQTYRRHRLRDAARFLPVVGIVLVLVPLLWIGDDKEAFRTSTAIEYLFVVWGGLVAVAFVISLYLRDEDVTSSAEDDREGPAG